MTGWNVQVEMETHTCGECGIQFAAPRWYFQARRDGDQNVKTFYCPNGHPRAFVESENVKLRRERDRLIQQAARLEDERRAAERAAAKERQERQRLEKRIGAGVCPCCSRTFQQLARHMKNKHPEVPFVPQIKVAKK
jgi:NMD protein affecting ribosome stability and mRNA decay